MPLTMTNYGAWEGQEERSLSFRAASISVDHEEWEASSERSDAFQVAVRVLAHEEWASDPARSGLFKQASTAVEFQDWWVRWSDDDTRSPLFKSAVLTTEMQNWEESTERSELFHTSQQRVTRRVQKQQQDIEVPRCAALLLAVAHMARAYNLGNEEKTELKSAIMDRTQSSSVYTALDSYERHGSHERFLHNLSEIAEHKLRMKHQEAETKQLLDVATLPPAWWYEDQTARVWLASWYECAGAEKKALSRAGSDADDEEEAEDTMSDSSEDMQDMPHLHVSIPRPGVEQTIQIANAKGGFEEYSPQGVADFDQWMCNTPVTTHRVKDRSMSFLEI